jgi:hypothetical protein
MMEGVPQHRHSCFPGCKVSHPAGQLGLPTLWPPARAVPKLPGFGRNTQWFRPGAWPPHSRLQLKGVTQSRIHRLLKGGFPQGRQTAGEDISEGGSVLTKVSQRLGIEFRSQPFTKACFSAGNLGGAEQPPDGDKAPLILYPRARPLARGVPRTLGQGANSSVFITLPRSANPVRTVAPAQSCTRAEGPASP